MLQTTAYTILYGIYSTKIAVLVDMKTVLAEACLVGFANTLDLS